MIEKKDNLKQQQDEIDLLELFSRIGDWFGKIFNNLFNIFIRIVYFFIRNAVWFIIFIILGVIVGIAMHKTTCLFYKSELIGFSHSIDNIEVIRKVNNWNYASDFTQEELNNIKTIGATYLLDINDDGIWDIIEDSKDIKSEITDTIILKQRTYGNFCIIVEVFDTTLIPKIKTKLFNYLENTKRVKSLNTIRITQQKALIPKVQKEIEDLDSLKKVEYFEKNKQMTAQFGEMLLIGEQEPKLYYEEILKLVEKQQAIEKELFLYPDPFEIILDFSVPSKEENDKLSLIKKYTITFFVFGFFIILYLDRRKYIINYVKKAYEKKE
jgi:hypothetical protein